MTFHHANTQTKSVAPASGAHPNASARCPKMRSTIALVLSLVVAAPASAWASTPAVEAATEVAQPPSTGHTDLVIGVGVLTSGTGLSLGHRTEEGLRVELGIGTALLLWTGISAGAGGSFIVFDSGRHRLEVPVMAYGVSLTCGTCGTDSSTNSFTGFGAATGLDWVVGRAAKESGLVFSLRGGVSTGTLSSGFENTSRSQVIPLAQLGGGWAF